MISIAGRGTQGAEMTPRDIATLLFAVVAPGSHETAAALAQDIGGAPIDRLEWNSDRDREPRTERGWPEFGETLPWPLDGLGPKHTALDAVERLIGIYASGVATGSDPRVL